VLQEAVDKSYHDELIPIAGAEGIAWSRETGGGGRDPDRRFGRIDLRGRDEDREGCAGRGS
jgi:hypothetical protein